VSVLAPALAESASAAAAVSVARAAASGGASTGEAPHWQMLLLPGDRVDALRDGASAAAWSPYTVGKVTRGASTSTLVMCGAGASSSSNFELVLPKDSARLRVSRAVVVAAPAAAAAGSGPGPGLGAERAPTGAPSAVLSMRSLLFDVWHSIHLQKGKKRKRRCFVLCFCCVFLVVCVVVMGPCSSPRTSHSPFLRPPAGAVFL
jgi:hypothetical protein